MREWEMFFNFCIFFFSLGGLVLFAFVIVKKIVWDYNEKEAVEDAEWILKNHCNESRSCTDCDRFLNDKGCCKYQFYTPWQWDREGEKKP